MKVDMIDLQGIDGLKKQSVGELWEEWVEKEGQAFTEAHFWRYSGLSGGPPCLVVQKNFPLCLFLSSSCATHVRLSKDAEKQADGCECSHNHTIYIYPNILGRQKRSELWRGRWNERGANSLHDTSWVLVLNTLCVRLQAGDIEA